MRIRTTRTGERGAALYTALFATLIFVGMTTAMVMVGLANKKEREAAIQRTQRRYLADAGISMALLALTAGESGTVASEGSPDHYGEGGIYVTVTNNGDSSFTIDSTGLVGGESRRLRCVARDLTQGVFNHAMFAGNEDNDPTYELDLGGVADEADEVTGDLFSGGDIVIVGDATVTGTLRATGTITGDSGEEGVTQPLPDIAGANYEVNHDFDVAQAFRDDSPSYLSDELGGSAWQLPEENPSHIFRLNPSDRSAEYLATAKDDYFLEDPYEAVNGGAALDEANSTALTLSGLPGEPGPIGNDKVYFIDGNLWLHNKRLFNLILKHSTDHVLVTFVVKGNIYFSDNLLIKNGVKDGVAFIAIEDSAVADSGNIYFGDDVFGTLERMDAFMYAENNFYDTNLTADGSTDIQVNGIMSAGNHVAINRDLSDTRHTKLELNYDDRIAEGDITLPGLPQQQAMGGTVRTMQVISVYEVESD